MMRPADLPDGRLEDELRAAFTGATDDLPPTRNPWARTQQAVARSRARRRAGALAAVAVAALTVVGTVLPLRGSAPDSATPEPGPTVTSIDVATWPTRGNLADRADLVAQVRQAAATEPEQRTVWSVPFLGDVDGVRVAFAVRNGDPTEGARYELVVLAGSAGTPPAAWRRSATAHGAADAPVLQAAVRGGDGVVRLVVATLTAGPRVEYSPRPLIDARGVVRREFVEVPLDAGVGAVSWSGTLDSLALQVRAGDGQPQRGLPMMLGVDEGEPTARPVRQSLPDSCSGPAFERLRLNLPNSAAEVALDAGYEPRDVREVTVPWCRSVGRHRIMLVGVTLVDGTALQTSVQEWAETDGTSTGSDWTGYPVPRGRAGTYPTHMTLAGVYVGPETAGATVLLSAPGGATAELVRTSVAGTTVVARAQLGADGVGVARATAGLGSHHDPDDELSVVVRDSAGREIERADGPEQDPWLRLPE